MHRSLITFLAIPLSLLVFAAPAWASAGQMDLGTIMDTLQATASNFGSVILPYAKDLMYTLITIDVVVTFSKAILNGDDLPKQLVTLVQRMMWYGLLLWLIVSPFVIKDIVNSFIMLGQKGAGVSAISPSGVFWKGINLLDAINAQFAQKETLLAIYPALVNLVITIIVFGCFAYISAQFSLAYIELWFYIAVYPIILAFGSTPWTKQYAMNTILKPVSFGLRFLVLYFVVGVTMASAKTFEATITSMSTGDMAALWSLAGGCIVLLLLAMKAPQLASDLLSNQLSLSAGDGVGAAVVAGGAIAAGASGTKVATKAAEVATSSVAAAAQVGSASVNAARASGATGAIRTTTAAASAVGSAAGQMISERVRGLGSKTAIGTLAQRISENSAGGIGPGSGPGSSTTTSSDPTSHVSAGMRPKSTMQTVMSHAQRVSEIQQQSGATAAPEEEA